MMEPLDLMPPDEEFGHIKTIKNGKYVLEFFPDGFVALQKELATGLHPILEKKLANHPAEEVDIKLAEIASHCSVVLEGTYTLAERDKLCHVLVGRLQLLRVVPQGQIIM